MNILSKLIRNRRMELNISQRELALLTTIDRTTLSEIEKGIRRRPKIDTIVKLSNGLGIPLSRLLYSAGYNYEEIKKIINIDNDVKKESDYHLCQFQIVITGECIVKSKNKKEAKNKFENKFNRVLLELVENNSEFEKMYDHSDIELYNNIYNIDENNRN